MLLQVVGLEEEQLSAMVWQAVTGKGSLCPFLEEGHTFVVLEMCVRGSVRRRWCCGY